jgi:uncharacterized protein
MSEQVAPVATSERIYTLDVIRGFALLGILIMNMPGFNTSFFAGVDGSHLFPQWWDRSAETVRDVLFAGKFNSMFSMLFAIGFTIQLERLEAKNPQHAKAIYLRRIFWLFVLGLIHTCVFWTGDVLHIYALLGLVLLALRRVPDKMLWTLFVLCLVYPVIRGIYRLYTTTPEDIAEFIALSKQWEASNNAAYGSGSFFEAALEHTRETLLVYTHPLMLPQYLGFYVLLFLTMLIGLYLGRHHFFQNSQAYLPLVRRVQWWALGIGLVTGAFFGYWDATVENPAVPTPIGIAARIAFAVCRVCIMAFYVATIVRAVHSVRWKPRLSWMAVTGRMPLTNYLMQTLMATFIFYGWGLGFWGEVGPALSLVLALAMFFAVQVPLSHWWLRRFETGPLEVLWRKLSYGRAPLTRTTASGLLRKSPN